jgi:hypothetical protein
VIAAAGSIKAVSIASSKWQDRHSPCDAYSAGLDGDSRGQADVTEITQTDVLFGPQAWVFEIFSALGAL